MNKEEKTMSRILLEIRKKHTNICEVPNSKGNTFQYKYFLNDSYAEKVTVIKPEEDNLSYLIGLP